MSSFPALDIVSILILLLLGRLLGLALSRWGISSSVGEIVAGLVMAVLIRCMGLSGEGIPTLASIGAIMLMFLSGLYTDYRDFRENLGKSTAVAAGGVAGTMALVYLALKGLGFPSTTSLIVAIVLSNTAVEVTAKVMLDDPPAPKTKALIMGAAFADDILALFMIALATSGALSREVILWSSVKVSLFLLISIFLLPRILSAGRLLDRLYRSSERVELRLLTFSVLMAFALSLLAAEMGLNAAIGAYTAGLAIASWGSKVEPLLRRRAAFVGLVDMIEPILRVLLTPLFFGYIGILMGEGLLEGITSFPFTLTLALLASMMLGKFIGCASVSAALGAEEPVTVGVAMQGRGMLEYVIIMVVAMSGLVDPTLFLAMTVASMVTMISTPLLYRVVRRGGEEAS